MNYKLVQAKESDLPIVKEYKKSIIFAYAKGLSLEEETKINKYIEETTKEDIELYQLIVVNEKCIGCLLLTNTEEGKRIDELYLEKEYRHKGIGSCILKEITKTYPALYLYVYKENKEAISLYQKYNFQIIKETETRYLMRYTKNK